MTSTDAALHGLSSAEAAARLTRYGPTEVETGRRFRVLREGLGLLANPLVLILLVAAVVSGFLGEPLDAGIIIFIVLLSVGLDFFQGFRSDQAANRLKSLVALTTTVVRDNREAEILVREVVPGDVLELRAGDLMAADATLLTPEPLTVDEAALTGESLPVEKRGAASNKESQLFAGTSVVSGIGEAVVTATGPRTQFDAIAHALIQRAPPTEFERGARSFGFIITRTVLGLVLFVFLVNALRQQAPLDSFLFALALAVGLTPEFLPMIMTVTLSQGAQRMAKEKVIVRRLEAIENLGNMDVLCSDKTGTLTRGSVIVQAHVDAWGHNSPDVLHRAAVNSALETGMQNTLDLAILEHRPGDIETYRRLAELPFDFERRRVSVLAEGPSGRELITKGAPESVLAVCASVNSADGLVPLSPYLWTQVNQTLEQLGRTGYHVLAVAHKPVLDVTAGLRADDERDLTFGGFVAFLDPPDPSAAGPLARLAAAGLSLKILSGDSELVCRTSRVPPVQPLASKRPPAGVGRTLQNWT